MELTPLLPLKVLPTLEASGAHVRASAPFSPNASFPPVTDDISFGVAARWSLKFYFPQSLTGAFWISTLVGNKLVLLYVHIGLVAKAKIVF